jgi:outer membrane protein OmpA-like peptidoglycan-associated protein
LRNWQGRRSKAVIKIFSLSCATLAIALTTISPANAQLLGGGLHGGLGGSFGGSLPMGTIRGVGDIGVTGTPERTNERVRSSSHVSHPSHAIVKTAVLAPALAAPTVPAKIVSAPALLANRSIVFVPAIPNLAVRRSAVIDAGIAPVAYAEVPAYVDQQFTVLQDELRGTGVRVSKQGQQIVLEMPSDVTFSFNKYNIQPRFYGVLDAVSHTLSKYPATYVDVNGHTDAIGSFSYNQVLSEKRADSVADFLAARQVNPARLHVQGFGKTEPVASNATIDGRAANRRVEIVLTPYAA